MGDLESFEGFLPLLVESSYTLEWYPTLDLIVEPCFKIDFSPIVRLLASIINGLSSELLRFKSVVFVPPAKIASSGMSM